MAIYGKTIYGTDYYGYTLPPQYRVDPFVAQPISYDSVMLSWNKPSGNILAWRVLKNRWGFPTDQDDGEILLDTTAGYPGNYFIDTNPVPGTYHYYAFYVLLSFEGEQWVRSGIAACLTNSDLGSDEWINGLVPGFFAQISQEELTADLSGNLFLEQFLGVFAWGADLIKTQYNTYLNVNDPWKISETDLYNLAAQVGINVNPDIHPYTLRKAVYYNATINKQKGTQQGIAAELSALTGWNADLTIGRNLLLNNDQSAFLDPVFQPWSANINYNLGEMVSYGSYFYVCILATANIGNAPTGTSSSNTWWSAILSTNSTSYLNNPTTGGINTWELISPANTSGAGAPVANSFYETVGVSNPNNTPSFTYNSLQIINKTGSTNPIWARSIARTATDISGVLMDGYPLNVNYTFETGSSPWTPIDNATLAQSNFYAYMGSNSLQITPDGATAQPGALCEFVPVLPAQPYTVKLHMLSPLAWASGGQVGINWYDNTQTFISSSSASAVPLTALNWTTLTIFAQAPSNAAFAKIFAQAVGTPATTQEFYVDNAVISSASYAPNKDQVTGDAIPVPSTAFAQQWNATTRYPTQSVVMYGTQPFIALKASTNTPPPLSPVNSATNEWAPVGYDQRPRLCLSAYLTGSGATPAAPFIEWYDSAGHFIARTLPRNPSPGSVARPDSFAYDSFSSGPTTFLNGRTTDDGSSQWAEVNGSFELSPYANGCTFPSVLGQRTSATISAGSQANCCVAVTFTTSPQAGQSEGLLLRYQNDSNYLRADQTTLKLKSGGSFSTLGTYSTAFVAGDRMVVQLYNNQITVFRNNLRVLQVTNGFNTTGTVHGLIVENT